MKSSNVINAILFPVTDPYGNPPYALEKHALEKKGLTPLVSGFFTLSTAKACGEGLCFPCLWCAPPVDSGRVLLYFHGNGCNLLQMQPTLEFYSRELNVACLGVEYPGYGPAEGSASEASVNAVAAAAMEWLLQSGGYLASDVVLFGRSIGSGPAVLLAQRLCRAGTPPCALVLQSAYTGINALASAIAGPTTAAFLLERWPSLHCIQRVTCPSLFIHGSLDTLIPAAHSQALHAASPAAVKELVLHPYVDHNSFYDSLHIVPQVSAFLQRLPALQALPPRAARSLPPLLELRELRPAELPPPATGACLKLRAAGRLCATLTEAMLAGPYNAFLSLCGCSSSGTGR